jgi:uncharacterized protein YutE (UPF0331/DUF86 family)
VPDFHDILPKLERLSHDREQLEAYRRLSREDFLVNETVQRDACYLFLTAIQGCIDASAELIAALGWRKPASYVDVFTVLGEEGVLTADFARRLGGMVRFHNILVHQYREIDFDRVYDSLQEDLGDFDLFERSILAFLENQHQEEDSP